MAKRDEISLAELRAVRWTKKGPFHGNPQFPDTCRLMSPNTDDRKILIKLSGNRLQYEDGAWNDITDPDAVQAAANPVVAENIVLKKRVETLIRTAAISEIEVRQLKEEIREAKQILSQLAEVA
jgi:hypothetical protein